MRRGVGLTGLQNANQINVKNYSNYLKLKINNFSFLGFFQGNR